MYRLCLTSEDEGFSVCLFSFIFFLVLIQCFFLSVESRRRREDDVMMPMMGEGMNPDVGPRPGMMNKRHFPPGNVILRADFQ